MNYMKLAIEQSMKAFKKGEVPVGAVIVKCGKVVSKAHNTRENSKKISGHAEINAIEKAAKKLKTWKLDGCEMYVTLEPCNMCKEAIKQSRISKVHYSTKTLKNIEYKTEFVLDKNEETETILSNFFTTLR